jgi:hypothetical protein
MPSIRNESTPGNHDATSGDEVTVDLCVENYWSGSEGNMVMCSADPPSPAKDPPPVNQG